MRKITATILSLCALTCTFAAFPLMEKTDVFARQNAKSIVANAQTPSVSTTLVAPSSYEQYLPLSEPSCVAVTENYTAIADADKIYVFDRSAGIYRNYQHDGKVTQLQFDSENKLYFLDASTRLYTLNPSSLEKTETGFVCSSFLINGTDVYFTHTSGGNSQIKKISLYDLSGTPTQLNGLDQLNSVPVLGFFAGELYFTTWNGIWSSLIKFDPKTNGIANVATFPSEFLSMSIQGDVLACALRSGGFSVYDLNELSNVKESTETTPLFHTNGNYSAVSIYGGNGYAVEDTLVRQFSLKNNAFTDYEIGSASASQNRFNGAKELYLAEETLFIADHGNDRISVYDTLQDTFLQPIATDLDPLYLASYGDTLLIANTDTAVLYDLTADNYGKKLTSYATFNGSVQGVTSVYGVYYLVTNKNQFLCLDNDGAGWEISATQKSETKYPTALASDPYGTIYVACSTHLYAYTETEFLSPTSLGKETASSLPVQIEQMSFDYRSNLYLLEKDTLHLYVLENGKYSQAASFDTQEAHVYGATPNANAFALSIKENKTYVLYENDYLVCRTDLNLPTLTNIAVDGADDRIFTNEPVPFSLVSAQKGALLVEFDFEDLQNANYFPYLSYERIKKNVTALKIGQTDVYDLIAVYDEQVKSYRTYLVYSDSCSPLSTGTYQTTYPEPEQKTAYLTNALSLYKLPYMTELLTLCNMPRGAQITLLGEITKLDRAYYYVSYLDENGVTHTGYVPQSYVTPTSGNTPPNTTPVGDAESNVGAIGRMIYLLLSFGVICLLVDYLLLRKPKDEWVDEHEDNPEQTDESV